jgi:secretion/DNA translocation related TadE-like protein
VNDRPDPEARGDRGAGAVLVLGLVAVTALAAVGVGTLGVATVARHRAEAAADLAALAAAAAAAGPDCSRATPVAGANGGDLSSCEVEDDGSVTVVVAVGVGRLGSAKATARAGQPAGASP